MFSANAEVMFSCVVTNSTSSRYYSNNNLLDIINTCADLSAIHRQPTSGRLLALLQSAYLANSMASAQGIAAQPPASIVR